MTVTEPQPYGPTWYAATMVGARERTRLTRDIDVDVCVIGAGLAGLTVAREVARRGWSVAVLEAGRIAGLASGRNGGFVSPGFAEGIEAIIERVGLPRARELWALSEGGVDYIRSAIRDSNMAGVDPHDGWLSVRRTDDESGSIEHVAMLRVEFGADVEAWPTEQVREVLRSRAYFQAVHYANAFHIHPLNYALGLAAAVEAAGARIFEHTTATAIDPAGVRKRIETPNGLVRAHHAVLATSVAAGSIDGVLGETIVPVSTYVAVTAPLGETLFDAVRYTGAVADTRRAGDYYRIVADDRLLWGGRFTTREAAPRRLKAMLRRDILRTYPQLDTVEIEYAWAGTMAYAVHKMPQIGELAPGYWLAGAFGGHGLNTTAMAGEMIARAILEGDDRWRLFSPYELVWAGGGVGRAAAQTIAWSMQARDAFAERISRYRDRARARAAAQQAQWMAEQAARRAEREARRAEEEAKRAAAEEARKQEAEARKAEIAARRAAEQARRAEQAEAASRLRAHVEAVRRARDELARQAAVPIVPEPTAPAVLEATVPEPAAAALEAAAPAAGPEAVQPAAPGEPMPEPVTATPETPGEAVAEAAPSGPVPTVAWPMRVRHALAGRIARYHDGARRRTADQRARWSAEQAARQATWDARRADEEARRAAAEEARKADIAARHADLATRKATEQARRAEQAEAARCARLEAEAKRLAEPLTLPGAVDTAAVAPEPAAEPAVAQSVATVAPNDMPSDAAAVAETDGGVAQAPTGEVEDAPVPAKKAARKPRATKRRRKDASAAPPTAST